MELDCDKLRGLYERLILQESYPGNVCPAEHVLVAYDLGMLSDQEGRAVEDHFAVCPSCREDFVAVGQAGQWFRQQEARVLAGLAAKGGAAGVLPWARCPSVNVLYRYLRKDLPETVGGKILRAEMQHHLMNCPDCARLGEEFRAAMAGPAYSLSELGSSLAAAVMDRLRGFFDGLAILLRAAGTPAVVRGAPGYRGYRGEEALEIVAPLVDSRGQCLVADDGQPRSCRFEILHSGLKDDGFLLLDLTVAKSGGLAEAGPCQVEASLIAGGVRIELPAVPLDERGRATFTGKIPGACAIEPIPPAALEVAVRQVSPAADNPPHADA